MMKPTCKIPYWFVFIDSYILFSRTDRKSKEVDQVEHPPPPDEMYQSSRSYQTIGDNLTADS